MFERDLTGAFSDCADLLAGGQTIDECLRRYPQFARDLRPMLETGMLVRRARYTPQEVMQAQDRVRFRIAQATANVSHPGAARSYARWLPLVASLVIVFLSLFGGASIAAETTLPGDFLYPVKRVSEAIRISLDSTGTLEAGFARRRIDEINQLLALARPASVDFRGEVESINGVEWRVASLTMQVGAGVPGAANMQVGDTAQVNAQTTAQGELVASEIRLLERRQEPLLPSPAPTQTTTQTPTVTATPAPSRTPAPPTNTPRPTQTPPPPTPITIQQESACAPTPPDSWVSYALRAGDTLSALAIATGETVERIIEVNCITNPTGLVVGEQIYLPFAPPTRPPSRSENEVSGAQSTGDGNDDSGASGSEGGEEEGDDSSGPGDDEDDDDSSGPGGGDGDDSESGSDDDEDSSGSGGDDDDSSDDDGDDGDE